MHEYDPQDDETQQRRVLFMVLANHDALPVKSELDYYNTDEATWLRAIDVLGRRGWLDAVVPSRETLSGGSTYETFTIAGIEFTSPRCFTPLTDPKPSPIEKLAGGVVVEVDGVRIALRDEYAEPIRRAAEAALVACARDDARGPLPSRADSRDENVVAFPGGGRGRQDAPQPEGA